MFDSEKPHPILAQIPLTVSPFISLPTATTLPYTYKSIPSSLPPSVTVDASSSEKPKYVISSSGHAAHPADILATCQALADHMKTRQAEGDAAIKEWEESIKQRELAEKRRVAPGWLDREEKLLQPTHAAGHASAGAHQSLLDRPLMEQADKDTASAMEPRSEGVELDRAFGGLGLKR
ncbi:uncharacterized protein GIQ15_06652 [Arthroderma uncinatum]|uniref:uncharacterized protein n=1 Tax=Arthroderma uncinatum TaxID=74035 RepID=UPI00144A5F29|nr:uncharacterized protein GIQ15_06652 [Arthroderma uncinatum]KAF3479676.1 hypothetical protein GIQ15_06652 [Arthroderma uncinatum]